MKEKIIPLSEPALGKAERASLKKCLDSGFVSSAGTMIAEFERDFASFAGVRHAVAVSSGTAAIHVALHAMGIGPGSTVIVPDLTFVASMNPVLYCGAEAELVDVQQDTWCLDPQLLEAVCMKLAAAGRKPAAVVPVHLYGCVCDMPSITAVAKRFDMKIIEDATEALGSKRGGRHAGTFGHAGCFSFNGNKLITTGSGGMVATNSATLARRVRHLVNQAKSGTNGYIHDRMGFNYRMSNLAAALGLGQMKRIAKLLAGKRAIAARYRKAFCNIEGLHAFPESPDIESSYWMYSIVLDRPARRNAILRALGDQQIQARNFFPPLHSQPYVKSGVWVWKYGKCVKANRGKSDHLAQRGLNLPSCPAMTTEEQQKVINCILDSI